MLCKEPGGVGARGEREANPHDEFRKVNGWGCTRKSEDAQAECNKRGAEGQRMFLTEFIGQPPHGHLENQRNCSPKGIKQADL